MKPNLLFNKLINSTILIVSVLLFSTTGKAQTYTTKANGAWSSASTWVGGIIPNATNIPATAVINIQHNVSYSSGNIVNNGIINISNPFGISPRLLVASSVNFTNNTTGKLVINSGEYQQYRFVGGGQSGSNQSGNFTNNGGNIQISSSYVEVAQNWTNQSTGIVVFKNSSLILGQNYQTSGTSIDTIALTSISIGWQGSGNFTEGGLSVYINAFRAELAGNGNFTFNSGVIGNGQIDYITTTNDFTGSSGNGKIEFKSGMITTGLSLMAYCTTGSYKPNGNISGPQTNNCSLNYFPAKLNGIVASSKMNFSSDPVLLTGTDRQVGAKYIYQGVAPGVDATVKIDSIVGGAVINVLDDNTGSNGGYNEAFQPQITSGPAKGKSYAIFTFNYFITGTSVPYVLDTFNLTAVDIDGTSNLKEFDQISAGLGSTANYVSSSPNISLTEVSTGTFLGIDVDGVTQNGVDTSSFKNMFTVSNTNVSSFTAKMGISTTTAQQTLRLFSLYTKGFNYLALSTLPIKLVSFDATLNKSKVDLRWTTASEENVSHFIVQRSIDGTNFSDAGMVFSADENSSQNINYSLNDDISTVKANVIYYKLCSVDMDGRMQYSDIRVIRISNEAVNNLVVLTYPNPVTNELRVTAPSTWQNKKVSYELYNVYGQLSMRVENGNGSQTESINVSNLNSGLYIVKVSCEGQTIQQKIIKF